MMARRRSLLLGSLAVAIAGVLASSSSLLATPGDLDPSFGSGGKISGQHPGFCKAVTLQSDGKILVAGASGLGQGPYGDFRVARYHPNGSLDTSFGTVASGCGTNGTVTTDSGGANDNLNAMVLQPDGKIVLGGLSDPGTSNEDFALVRYLPNGCLDPSFGNAGLVRTVLSNWIDHVEGLVLQGDGKLVATGPAVRDSDGVRQIALVRYDASGTLDPTFGVGGVTRTSVPGSVEDSPTALALQADGKLVVAGQVNGPSPPFDFFVARYDAAGTLDPSFGAAGIVITDFGGNETPRSVVVQPDQKILVGGYANGGSLGIRLARYNSDGTLDASFGTGGKVSISVPASPSVIPMALLPDGRIIAAGEAGTDPYAFLVERFLSNGALDATFGTGGFVTTSFTGIDDEAVSLVVDSAGRTVVCGFSTEGPGGLRSFAIARYLGDCGNGTVDAGEQCDDGNTTSGDCCSSTCEFAPSTTVCRLAAGDCDLAETCSGTSGSCPPDALQPSTNECRASAGDCDQAEFCTGASVACPADALTPAGTVCRPNTGLCDVAEACTGSSAACPPDELAPATTTCRPASGDCDAAESCTGSSSACPNDDVRPNGTVCRASVDTCDVAETCDGAATACPPDAFKAASVVCRAALGDCDVAESCTGSSAPCPVDLKRPSSFICRAASGACDVAEACDGSSASCPADATAPDGTSCSDGSVCTTGDVCASGVCQGNGAACGRCTVSGNACTTPADCDPGEGCCGNGNEDPTEQCDDGNLDDGDCCSNGCQTEPATICDPIPDLCAGVVPPHLISNPTIKRPMLKDRSRPADHTFDQWKTTGDFELPDLQDIDPETEQVDFVLSQNDGANNSVELYHATLAPPACPNGVCFIARRTPLGFARSWRFSRPRSLPDVVDAVGWRKGSFTRSGTTKFRFSLSGSDAAIDRPLLSSGVRRIRQTIKIGDDCITRQLDCQRNASETTLKCVHASCGNGVVSPGEQCGEATLPACGGSKVCDTCKCVDP